MPYHLIIKYPLCCLHHIFTVTLLQSCHCCYIAGYIIAHVTPMSPCRLSQHGYVLNLYYPTCVCIPSPWLHSHHHPLTLYHLTLIITNSLTLPSPYHHYVSHPLCSPTVATITMCGEQHCSLSRLHSHYHTLTFALSPSCHSHHVVMLNDHFITLTLSVMLSILSSVTSSVILSVVFTLLYLPSYAIAVILSLILILSQTSSLILIMPILLWSCA
jgi:hypothetical protein